MSLEVLHVERVQKLMDGRGLKSKWVIGQLGLNRTAGYDLLREGRLPKDHVRKTTILKKLGKLFGVDERQLVIRLEEAKAG